MKNTWPRQSVTSNDATNGLPMAPSPADHMALMPGRFTESALWALVIGHAQCSDGRLDPDQWFPVSAESGIGKITTPAFAIREHGQVVAAAGYRDWPCGTAHLSVLTASAARGRGLAQAAASAAVAHAIAEGRLPQWRARPQASRRVARALGFRELGAQVSIRLAAAVTSREHRS